MTDTKLKPCPFCGSSAKLTRFNTPNCGSGFYTDKPHHYAVVCTDARCGIQMDCGLFDEYLNDPVPKVEAWNRRALSARASAGENLSLVVARMLTFENSEYVPNIMFDQLRVALKQFTATPQPAQAGAGTECEHRRSTWRLDMSSGTCKDCGAGLLPDGSSTPASPATGESSPFTCDECGKVECCPEFHTTPQPAAAQHWSADSPFYKDDVVSEQDAKECFKGVTFSTEARRNSDGSHR